MIVNSCDDLFLVMLLCTLVLASMCWCSLLITARSILIQRFVMTEEDVAMYNNFGKS